MPSPADRVRLELLLRGTALAALSWLTMEAFAGRPAPRSVALTAPLTGSVLAEWSAAPTLDQLGVRFGAAPSPMIRDWLVALRRAGAGVRWSDGGIPALAIEAERRPDPAGRVMIRVAGPGGAPVYLTDDLGPLDSVTPGAFGASLRLSSVAGPVRARVGTRPGEAAVRPASVPAGRQRHLVLLGAAGWEAKFVAAALQERGWEIDARFAVAPGIAATQGSPVPFDTARHAAIIALDSTAAAYAPAIARFVHSGGGLLLGPDAVGVAALRALAPGRGTRVARPRLGTGVAVSRELLGLRDLAPLVADAYPLERRGDHVAVAVRREGAGRVGQTGYRETWRWRLQGGPDGPAGHREWWSAVVAAVAGGGETRAGGVEDPAPRAALFSALGPPSDPAPHPPRALFPVVLAVLLAGLFGEWSSRRLRGAA